MTGISIRRPSASAAPADATTTSKGIVQLAGDLAGTAASPTVPALSGKLAAASNLSDLGSASTARTNLGLGAAATSALSSAIPSAPSATAAAVGTSTAVARADHSHPRVDWSAADYGYLTWTFDPQYPTAASALPTSGRVEVARIHVPVAISVTNIVTWVNAAGSSLTSGQCFAGLYKASDSSQVAVTADQATSWATAPALKTMALASGPFALTAGDYYVAFLFNGTTGPSLARVSGLSANFLNANLTSPNLRYASANTSQTSLPATLGTQTNQGFAWWVALS